MAKKKKEEIYRITPFGLLTLNLGLYEDQAERILDTLELYCRRLELGTPALLLDGRNSTFIGVKNVKDRKKRKSK